jgi:nucleolar MIF4G domain-containing protein 1
MPAVEPSPAEEKKPKKESAAVKKKRKREGEGKHKPKSNFQEYLEMEMGGAVSMEEDLEMEKWLAKKLKVKKGKLGGPDDGMDELFADLGFGGNFGSDDEANEHDWNVENDTKLDRKGKKKKKKVEKDDTETEELNVGDGGNCRKKKKKKVKEDNMETEELDVRDDENEQKQKKKKKVKQDDMEMEEPDYVGEKNDQKKKKKKKKKKNKDDSEVEEPDDGGVDMDEENDGAVLESEANVIAPIESKGKYVPPSLRAASNSESEEIAQMRRRVRGLSLNALFLLHVSHLLILFLVSQVYSLV